MLAVVRILASQADAVSEAWPRYAMRLEALFSETMAWLGPEVARETQEMLAQINIAAQVSGFVGSAGSIAMAAAAALARRAPRHVAFADLRIGLLDGRRDDSVRAACATALGGVGELEAVLALREVLTDEAHAVRRAALMALGQAAITLDVGTVPEKRAHRGAMVELLGPHVTVDDVAALAQTIGYEVLTSLGRRYQRTYIG